MKSILKLLIKTFVAGFFTVVQLILIIGLNTILIFSYFSGLDFAIPVMNSMQGSNYLLIMFMIFCSTIALLSLFTAIWVWCGNIDILKWVSRMETIKKIEGW